MSRKGMVSLTTLPMQSHSLKPDEPFSWYLILDSLELNKAYQVLDLHLELYFCMIIAYTFAHCARL
jgi:hypothetical protein